MQRRSPTPHNPRNMLYTGESQALKADFYTMTGVSTQTLRLCHNAVRNAESQMSSTGPVNSMERHRLSTLDYWGHEKSDSCGELDGCFYIGAGTM